MSTTPPAVDDSITVTTATQTPDEVRANLGLEPETPPEAVVPPAVPEPSPLEAELDRLEPPVADETPVQKTERRSRSEKKVLREIALRKQAEDRATAAERELADLRRAQPPPSPPAPKPGATPAAVTPAAPTFTFPTFEQYQTDHPDVDYEAYSDLRTDARFEWNREKTERDTQQRNEQARFRQAQDAADAAAVTFKAEHPDYEQVLDQVKILDTPATKGFAEGTSPIQQLLAQSPLRAQILYYLGSHPEDAARLMQAPTPGELHEIFGEIKYAVKASAPSPAAPAGHEPTPPAPRPPKPVTEAPAPLSAVAGGASPTRTLQSLAAQSEDADDYIAERKRLMRAS